MATPGTGERRHDQRVTPDNTASRDLLARAQEAFLAIVDRPAGEWEHLLAELCAADPLLMNEVRSLLAHDALADESFLAASGTPRPQPDATQPDWAESLIGKQIGQYTLTRLIAAGGMGHVFAARQEHPAREVAVKILRPGFGSRSALARFRLEPEVLGRLQHPNIAQVFEAGLHVDEQGTAAPFFAMELIADAQALDAYADREKLDLHRRLELFAKVCDAVHHGHQKGVIHRDLKPGNILVGRDGEPKVIDFGVARATDADIARTTQCTRVGELVGTICYMSPEQCDGDSSKIDTRSDIYSLGVVLYELLTGAAPYEATDTTIYGAVRAIKDEPPRLPSTLKRRLRGDVDAILLKALEKDPARRYASAADLVQDIRRHLAGDPIEARRPSWTTSLARWMVRHSITATAMACVLIAAATIALTSLWVWYNNLHPDRLICTEGRDVRILARNGREIDRLRVHPPGEIRFAEALRPETGAGTRVLAAIGFARGPESGHPHDLCVYDMARGFGEPLWHAGVRKADLPDFVDCSDPNEFNADRGAVFDIFASVPGDEVVAVFAPSIGSPMVLRVYSASGELLYQVWHRGALHPEHWMAEPGLLICTGSSNDLKWLELGLSDTETDRPNIVLAIRPQLGHVGSQPISMMPTSEADSPAWSRCVYPPVPKDGQSMTLQASALVDQRDPASHVCIIWKVRKTGAAVIWHLDRDGRVVQHLHEDRFKRELDQAKATAGAEAYDPELLDWSEMLARAATDAQVLAP